MQFSFAQKTVVSGKVTDILTGEPVPFVTAIFKGTTIGINTDFNGNYSLVANQKVDSIVFRCIGYIPVTMRVKYGQTQVINIDMKVNKVELGEAVVHAGEDPAIILFRKIQKNKDNNNRKNLDYYQYETYNKLEFDLLNIEKLKSNKLMKPFAFIFEKVDSSETNRRPFLPVFITENISDCYFRNSPKSKREYIKASKVSGVENASVTQFLGDMYQNIDIYDNYVDIYMKSIVSPIANVGLIYYRYSLVDSANLDGNWCYHMTFKPKMKQSNTFIGDFWVHDTTFAVRKLNMRISDDININFIEDMAMVQEFARIDSNIWMKTKDNLVLQFAPREKGVQFIGRKSTSFKNIVVNKEIPDSIFKGNEEIIIDDSSGTKEKNYWDVMRHDSLNQREKNIYNMVDTIQSLPAYKTWVDLFTLFITGYKTLGPVELGPFYTLASFNSIEGARFRLGGRTSPEFSERLQLNGYVAYGTEDEQFKYSIGFRYILKRKPRQTIGAQYKYDIQQLGQSENAFQDDNILSSIFRRSPSNKLTFVTGRKFWYEKEWLSGFSNTITLINANLDPLGELSYAYYPNYPDTTVTRESIITSEISLMTRFLFREQFIETKRGRVSVGSMYPLIRLYIGQGIKGVFNSDFSYTRVTLKISDEIRLKPFGWGYYTVEAGKFFGTAPYPILTVQPGNETYFYDYLSFNMMNYYEFVSDQYVSLFYTHHFDGLFLDRIPLLRKLKFREVATLKVIEGSLSQKNRDILVDPNVFSDLKKPYLEAGVGVENILKFFRIDFLWRITYIDQPYKDEYMVRFPQSKPPTRFGIRGSFQVVF